VDGYRNEFHGFLDRAMERDRTHDHFCFKYQPTGSHLRRGHRERRNGNRYSCESDAGWRNVERLELCDKTTVARNHAIESDFGGDGRRELDAYGHRKEFLTVFNRA